MFIGHFALGMGAKKIAPAVSLGTLCLACQLAATESGGGVRPKDMNS
jgi:hypothetical protein